MGWIYCNFLKKLCKIFFIFPFIFVIASCGNRTDIEQLLSKELKDPGSVKFKDYKLSEDKNRACIVWNAKNSLGGYGDWSYAEFKRENSQWKLLNIDGDPGNCTDYGFGQLDQRESAKKAFILANVLIKSKEDGLIKIIDLLKKLKTQIQRMKLI